MSEIFDEQFIRDKDALVKIVNDMFTYVKASAEEKARIDNEFKKKYVVGDFKESEAEDYFAISNEAILPKNVPIPTPIEKASVKDAKTQLDNLIDLLYAGDQACKNEEAVHGFTDGYKKQRLLSMYQVKYLKSFVGSEYTHPHYDAVVNAEFHNVLDFVDSEMVVDMIYQKQELHKKYFANINSLRIMRERCEYNFGEGDFVELSEYSEEKGLGWKDKKGKIFTVDIDGDGEVPEVVEDFQKRVKKLDDKYRIKF